MAGTKIKLDKRGIESLLKSAQVEDATKEAADAVAGNVEAMGITVGDRDGGSSEYALPVTVRMVTTDRAHAIVALAHPAGEAVQAKHGCLTKAAAEAGLDFNSR